MSSLKPDLSNEYSFIRIPYDAGVKVFKQSKKTIEKEMSSILNSILALKKEANLTKSKTTNSLSNLINRLQSLKRKLDDDYREEDMIYDSCKKRLLHLNSIDPRDKDSVYEYQNFRLHRLIVEYLLRNECVETAKKISTEYGIEDFVNIDFKVFEEYNRIINELYKKNCEPAFKWCSNNKTKLAKINSQFEVKLMFQEFIEMVKKDERDKALEYIRKYSNTLKNQNIDEVKKAMGCLCYYQNIDKFPAYKTYFEEERWNDLIAMFQKESFAVSGITSQSNLEITLQAGLSSLKTQNCTDEHLQRPEMCPVCHPSMNQLAKMVPSTHKVISSVICRITGEIMDEHNPPVALPNGQVYSLKAIKMMAERDDGRVVCPATKTECHISDVTKIYIS